MPGRETREREGCSFSADIAGCSLCAGVRDTVSEAGRALGRRVAIGRERDFQAWRWVSWPAADSLGVGGWWAERQSCWETWEPWLEVPAVDN